MTDTPLRLDSALVQRGLARSRAQAQALVAAGQVFVAGRAAARPSLLVSADDLIEVVGARCPYVSRAGLKLEAALETFGLSVAQCVALDIGASTGGFSDCLLQRGAARVDAVDVGHGQLAPSLADEPRLFYREGINARTLSPADFPCLFDMVVADLSFISLSLILPVVPPLLRPRGNIICLVKPQFEVGAERLGKRGIVRDPQAHQAALERVREAARQAGLRERGCRDSPLLGSEGNREFLLWLARAGEGDSGAE